MEEEETSSLLLPPYITNTVPHASECDLMVPLSISLSH